MRVEYGEMHLVCFKCEVYGHCQDQRFVKIDVDKRNDVGNQGVDGGVVSKFDSVNKGKVVTITIGTELIVNAEVFKTYGHWMLVAHKPRKPNKKKEVR